MANPTTQTEKEFLFHDQNVKYSFDLHDNNINIVCNHPMFISHFQSDSVSMNIDNFFNTAHKGTKDYDFFEKLKISLQEHMLDHGVKA